MKLLAQRLVLFAIALGVAGSLVACGSNSGTPTAPTATVSSMSVTGSAPTLGTIAVLKAIATMSDGTAQDVTNQAVWATANPAIATVSAVGMVTGVSDGSVKITAIYQRVRDGHDHDCRLSSIAAIHRTGPEPVSIAVPTHPRQDSDTRRSTK